ncbi:MAG: hypothetical protein ABR543_04270 [Gemmatimonadaceae bacterium]
MINQEVAQPLRLRAFFEGDVNRPAHTAEVLDDGASLSREDRSRDHAALPRGLM